MRQINAGLFISLDGVVEAPEKWTGPYFNDQVGQAVGTLMATNDALLLGRVTYEGFAAAFGGQSGGMADQMNNTPKCTTASCPRAKSLFRRTSYGFVPGPRSPVSCGRRGSRCSTSTATGTAARPVRGSRK